jgi:hypothetical protein
MMSVMFADESFSLAVYMKESGSVE